MRFKSAALSMSLLASTLWYGCGVEEVLNRAKNGGKDNRSDNNDLNLSSVTPDGRPRVAVTVNPSPWASPLRASAETVTRFGLTSDLVATNDTETRTVFDLRHAAAGEGVDLEILRTLLQRYATQRGYANFNTFLTDYRTAARAPAFKLASPSGDLLKDMLNESNAFVLGTAGTKTIVQVSCGGCHSYVGPKLLANNSRVLITETFSAAQPSRQTTPVDSATVFSDIDALLTAGPNAADSVELKAQYVAMKLLREKMNRKECDGAPANQYTGEAEHWKCSTAYVNAFVANSSARDVIDRGYLIALALAAQSSDIGAAFTLSKPTDLEVDSLTLPYTAQSLDWGGARSNITGQLLNKDPLTIDKRAARSSDFWKIYAMEPTGANGAFALNYANGFAGMYSTSVYTNYLFGATYLRLPTLSNGYVSASALALGGFGTTSAEWTRFVNALPRYTTTNLSTDGDSYFGDLIAAPMRTSAYPDSVLATYQESDYDAAVTSYNTYCSSCHGNVSNFNVGANGTSQSGILRPTVDLSYVANGAQTTYDIINQIVIANGNTTALPSITSRAIFSSPGWNLTGVKLSPSYRTGAYKYTRRNPYAGHSDALAFLNAGGGQAAKGTFVVPGERNNKGEYAPLAIGTDRAALTATYGRGEETGYVKHPTFTPVTGTAAEKLAAWLNTCMADGLCIVVPATTSGGMMTGGTMTGSGAIPYRKVITFRYN